MAIPTGRHEVTVFTRDDSDYGPDRVLSSGRLESRVLPDLRFTIEETFAL